MSFDNPKGLHAARSYSNGEYGVRTHAETIWNSMTFNDNGFTVASIAKDLQKETGLMPKTAQTYVAAFFRYCRAAPEEFSGPSSRLIKIGQGKYALADNPER